MIRLYQWRHRDGGRVVQITGTTWILEFSYARRRREFGVRVPFKAWLRTGLVGD